MYKVVGFDTLRSLEETTYTKAPGNGNRNGMAIVEKFRQKAKRFEQVGRENADTKYALLSMYEAIVVVDGEDIACTVFDVYALFGIGSLHVSCNDAKEYKKIRQAIWA